MTEGTFHVVDLVIDNVILNSIRQATAKQLAKAQDKNTKFKQKQDELQQISNAKDCVNVKLGQALSEKIIEIISWRNELSEMKDTIKNWKTKNVSEIQEASRFVNTQRNEVFELRDEIKKLEFTIDELVKQKEDSKLRIRKRQTEDEVKICSMIQKSERMKTVLHRCEYSMSNLRRLQFDIKNSCDSYTNYHTLVTKISGVNVSKQMLQAIDLN